METVCLKGWIKIRISLVLGLLAALVRLEDEVEEALAMAVSYSWCLFWAMPEAVIDPLSLPPRPACSTDSLAMPIIHFCTLILLNKFT